MERAVKTEPEDGAQSHSSLPPPPSPGTRAPVTKVDISLAALALFHERLRGQHAECSRAFSSLQLQIMEAIRNQQAALAAAEAAGTRPGAAYYAAASAVVKASSVLFRYLFEGLFVHQLDACEDVAAGLERAAQHHQTRSAKGPLADEAAAESAAALRELREAVYMLRQVPARVRQVQRDLLPEVPLMMGPPPPVAPAREVTVQRTSSATKASSASAAVARRLLKPSNAAARRLFAVSAGYGNAERSEIAALVRDNYRCDVLLLPDDARSATEEEEAAVQAGCCCLVTERVADAYHRDALAIACTSFTHLRDYAQTRGVRDGRPTTMPQRQGTETAKTKAAAEPPAREAKHVALEGEGETATLDSNKPSNSAGRQPLNELSTTVDNDKWADDDDDEEDEDVELMELLEMLDAETHRHLPGSVLGGPFSSQLPWTPRGEPSTAEATAAGDADVSQHASPLASQLADLSSILGGPKPRGGKRRRMYTVEKASASFSQARRKAEPLATQPRPEARTAGSGTEHPPQQLGDMGQQRGSSAEPEEAAEDEVIPSQLPSLSSFEVMESQMVQFHHVGDDVGMHRLVIPAVDMSNEAERALVASRPPPGGWVFQVSNSCKDRRKEILEAIRGLGSEVDTGSLFNPETTHLVVAEGVTERTEKYLSACAAGKFIVPPRYVFDSARRGHWLLGRMAEYNTNPLRRFFACPTAGTKAQTDTVRGDGALAAAAAASGQRPFQGWRVLLLVSHPSVASGIGTVLRAGGCEALQALVFNGAADESEEVPQIQLREGEGRARDASGLPIIGRSPEGVLDGLTSAVRFDATLLQETTHILVECLTMSCAIGNQGNFELPPWVPRALRDPALYSRIFTLELLYYCLCTSHDKVFDERGALLGEERLVPACRVEPFVEVVGSNQETLPSRLEE